MLAIKQRANLSLSEQSGWTVLCISALIDGVGVLRRIFATSLKTLQSLDWQLERVRLCHSTHLDDVF